MGNLYCMGRYKFHIHFQISDGSVILGASGLTGKTWAGSLWFYEDPENAPDVDKCSAGVQTKAGITEVQWIDESRIAVGSDTGKYYQKIPLCLYCSSLLPNG